MKINFKRKKKTKQQHQAHVEQLQEHCKQAWNYLKKHPGGKLFGIPPRPWILLLGTAKSGKTSLLRGTSLPLTSPHKSSLETIKSTKLVDWWASKEVVFIDPKSEIALPTNAIETTRWETLLETVDRYRMMRSLHHVILVIDLPQLISLTDETLDQLSTQLQSLQALTKIIPISIVISKCDKLDGFSEMFDDMEVEERRQIFGILFSKKERDSGLAPAFEGAFSALMLRLKSRLLNRLHREQNLEKRKQIYRFPSKLLGLSKSLKTLITRLPFSNTIPLHGIYFTSITDHRAYFIDSMIQSTISVSKQPLSITKKYASERLLAFPIAAVIIFGFTLLWHAGYNQTIRIIDKTQEELTSPSANIPKNLPWLSELNILSSVLETIHEKQVIRYQWVGLLQTHQLKKLSKKEYQKLLHTQFTPYIKSTLLLQIQLGMKGDKLALFDALKAYLSITEKKHYNKNIIMNWYRTYWKALYPKNLPLQAKLQHHLFILMESNKPLWQPDTDLIKQAQHVLQKLPLEDLAFLELQGEYPSINVSIFPNGDLDGVLLKNATVPSFFSTAHFKEIFSQKIPHIKEILARGNWVLGTTKGKTISSKKQADIAKKIRKMYLQYYTNVWAGTVANIHLKPANSYSDVLERINNVLDDHSGLTQLLKLVIGNASLDGGATNKNLTAVKAYLNKDKKSQYIPIKTVLTNLKNEIQRIQKGNNPDKASYLNAITRFKQKGVGDPIGDVFAEAKKNPEPIRSWLNTIALSSWEITLIQTRTYLNKIWQTIVLPVYYNEIENRYPVFPDSRENISLKNFNDFFGPNGTVGAFFIYYLQPFVNTTQNYWTWKSLNGTSLNIPQKALNTFIRASIIQQMFFTDDRNKPSFRFILAPLSLSGNSKEFTLNVGGQIYNISHKSHSTKQFAWPGPDPSFVSAQFITKAGKNPTSTYNGPWSWFRMLNANSLQTTTDPRQFTLIIQSDSNSASFRVIAEHRVNPLVPGVIGKYRCPNKL